MFQIIMSQFFFDQMGCDRFGVSLLHLLVLSVWNMPNAHSGVSPNQSIIWIDPGRFCQSAEDLSQEEAAGGIDPGRGLVLRRGDESRPQVVTALVPVQSSTICRMNNIFYPRPRISGHIPFILAHTAQAEDRRSQGTMQGAWRNPLQARPSHLHRMPSLAQKLWIYRCTWTVDVWIPLLNQNTFGFYPTWSHCDYICIFNLWIQQPCHGGTTCMTTRRSSGS